MMLCIARVSLYLSSRDYYSRNYHRSIIIIVKSLAKIERKSGLIAISSKKADGISQQFLNASFPRNFFRIADKYAINLSH